MLLKQMLCGHWLLSTRGDLPRLSSPCSTLGFGWCCQEPPVPPKALLSGLSAGSDSEAQPLFWTGTLSSC